MSEATFRSLTITANNGVAYLDQESGRYRYRYTVTVESDGTGETIRFRFHDSIANYRDGKRGLGPTDLLWAFRCFVDDAAAGQMTFQEFCDTFGYDEDSRSAHRTWQACRASAAQYRRLWHRDTDPYDILNELSDLGIE